jgi:diguanylate cyclase (GGDEF)-like protein
MCKRNSLDATLILFDLDEFKPINDTFGHAEGDRALVAFSDMLKHELRDADVFARLGGDEFVALVTGTNEENVAHILTRMQTSLSAYNAEQKRGYNLKFSAGFVTVNENNTSIEAMLEAADAKMYENKKNKKG